MWRQCAGICRLLATLLLLSLVGLSVHAQGRAPRENSLNGVAMNASFLEVLGVRGAPHFIGPALPSAAAVLDILDPPPLPETGMGMPVSVPTAVDPNAPAKKPMETYIIWLYQGNGRTPDPNAGYSTYVLFNKYGLVAGVAVAASMGVKPPGVGTSSGVSFGTSMFDLTQKYGYPEPFVRVGDRYFCAYPDRNVTFALDSVKRKVIGISMGVSVTVFASASDTAITPDGTGLPSNVPPARF